MAEQQQQQQKEEKSSQVFTKEKSFGESSVSHQQQQEQKGTFPLHSLFHSFVLLSFLTRGLHFRLTQISRPL